MYTFWGLFDAKTTFLLTLVNLKSVFGICESPILLVAEHLFNTSGPQALVGRLLGNVQEKCTSGRCPRVDVGRCQNESVDDVQCEIPRVFESSVKLGTDAICDTGCSDWECKAACQGIDVGICHGADWVLCKAGCLGIPSCVHKCEIAIVEPCEEKLVCDCSEKCEKAFSDCKSSCERELSMSVVADFERLQGVVTTMRIASVDLDCAGNGVFELLRFNATVVVEVGGAALDLRLRTVDASVSSSSNLALRRIRLVLTVPLNGTLLCGIRQQINISVESASVANFDLDVDLQLDQALSTVAAVVCAGLPVCRDAIKIRISTAIKGAILSQVPSRAAEEITVLLRGLVSRVACPPLLGHGSTHLQSRSLVI